MGDPRPTASELRRRLARACRDPASPLAWLGAHSDTMIRLILSTMAPDTLRHLYDQHKEWKAHCET